MKKYWSFYLLAATLCLLIGTQAWRIHLLEHITETQAQIIVLYEDDLKACRSLNKTTIDSISFRNNYIQIAK